MEPFDGIAFIRVLFREEKRDGAGGEHCSHYEVRYEVMEQRNAQKKLIRHNNPIGEAR